LLPPGRFLRYAACFVLELPLGRFLVRNRLFCFGASPGALPCAKPPATQPPDIPGWSALDAGVACLSRSSLHRQILPASARFGRRVYISASGRQFRYSTLAGLQFTHTSLPEALNKYKIPWTD